MFSDVFLAQEVQVLTKFFSVGSGIMAPPHGSSCLDPCFLGKLLKSKFLNLNYLDLLKVVGKSKKYIPGDLPWYKVKRHLQQTKGLRGFPDPFHHHWGEFQLAVWLL